MNLITRMLEKQIKTAKSQRLNNKKEGQIGESRIIKASNNKIRQTEGFNTHHFAPFALKNSLAQ